MNTSSENKYKNFVFTWNANSDGDLIQPYSLDDFLKQYAEVYVFQEERGEETHRLHYQGAFKTKIRKRVSTVIKEFEKEYGILIKYLTVNRMCGDWEENYNYCTKEDTRVGEVFQSTILEEYEQRDLYLLKDRRNWFPWQTTLANKVLLQNSLTVSIADDREIIWIEDSTGCTGKSKFCKLLCSSNSDIIKLPFGTSSQLRSSVICAGRRKLYIIDIPRTTSDEDDMRALISTIEDVKNGYVVSSMYGKYQDLFMEPPHIVIFSNDSPPYKMLTSDRWTSYTIDKDSLTLKSVFTGDLHPGNGFRGSVIEEDDIDEMENERNTAGFDNDSPPYFDNLEEN